MDQGSWLQGVFLRFIEQAIRCQSPQFVVNHGQQLRGCFAVTRGGSLEQLGHVVHITILIQSGLILEAGKLAG
jgi:hypothetical protein